MSRFPVWFRVAFAAMAIALIVPFVMLKTGVGSDAVAYAVRSAGDRIRPLVAADAMLPARFELPADGSYAINGMPVEYNTYPVRESAATLTRRFQLAFEQAGYEQTVVDAGGAPALVAVHPETKMMLTMRLVRDRKGTPGVRLTQQDLSKLDPAFVPEIPGLPVYPGATDRFLVSAIEGRTSQSLSYRAVGTVRMVEHFYREEMRTAGWQYLDPPVRLPEGSPIPLFFERNGLEASVMIVPEERSAGCMVMVTFTGDPELLS